MKHFRVTLSIPVRFLDNYVHDTQGQDSNVVAGGYQKEGICFGGMT